MSKEFPYLKIHSGERNLPHILVVFIIIDWFQLRQVFDNLLNFRGVLLEVGTFGAQMSRFVAVEAKSFLDAFLVFLGGEFSDLDNINVHGIRISGFGRSVEGLIRLVGRFDVLLGNFIGTLPLGLEGDGFLVPVMLGPGRYKRRLG